MGITARNGAVLQISVNEATLVPYVVNTLRDSALAIQLAARLNLPGADDLYLSEFNRMLGSNDVAAAARLAGESPNGERERGRGRGRKKGLEGGGEGGREKEAPRDIRKSETTGRHKRLGGMEGGIEGQRDREMTHERDAEGEQDKKDRRSETRERDTHTHSQRYTREGGNKGPPCPPKAVERGRGA